MKRLSIAFFTLMSATVTSQITQEEAVQRAIDKAPLLGAETPDREPIITARRDSRPTKTKQWQIDFKYWSATIDEKGHLTMFASATKERAWRSTPPETETLLPAELRARTLEILHQVLTQARHYQIDSMSSGIRGEQRSYILRLVDERHGFRGGQSFTITLDAYSGNVLSIVGASTYPYAGAEDLISPQSARDRAREFYVAHAPTSIGPWPGEVAVPAQPKWQWPWPLWDSPGTQRSLDRRQWELAFPIVVNGYEIHVNAHNGEIMGGRRLPAVKRKASSGVVPNPARSFPITNRRLDRFKQPEEQDRANPVLLIAVGAVGGVLAVYVWGRLRK